MPTEEQKTDTRVLNPQQVDQYYAEQGQAANPLSPLQWLDAQEPSVISTDSARDNFKKDVADPIAEKNAQIDSFKESQSDNQEDQGTDMSAFFGDDEVTSEQDAINKRIEANLAREEQEANRLYTEGVSLLSEAAQSQIESLKAQWAERKEELVKANNANFGTWKQGFIRGGQSEYSPGITSDFLSDRERKNNNKVAELDRKYSSTIAQVNSALAQGKYELASDLNKKLTEIEDESIALAQKALDEAATVNQQLKVDNAVMGAIPKVGKNVQSIFNALNGTFTAEEIKNSLEAFESSAPEGLNDLIETAYNNGAPQEVIDAILSSTSLAESYLAAGNYGRGGSGVLGEYNRYVADATGAGQTPISFDEYQTRDANRKAKASGGGSGADLNKLLTISEVQTFGVPYGTTVGQVIGKVPTGKPTEGNLTANLYATRMKSAAPTIDELEEDIVDMNPASFSAQLAAEKRDIFSGSVSDEIRQVRQAERNFLNAVLRRESGAVIADEEFANGAKQYFPRPGDDEKTLEQKRKNRNDAMEGLIIAAGPAYTPGEQTTVGQDAIKEQEEADTKLLTIAESNPEVYEVIGQMEEILGRPITAFEFLQEHPEYNQ